MVDDRQILVCGSISVRRRDSCSRAAISLLDEPGRSASARDNGVMSTIFTKIIEGEIPGRFVGGRGLRRLRHH